jgi:hypothetical protein
MDSKNLLRGHALAKDGVLGESPMGTQFGLVNVDLERRLAVLPFFGTFNLPYLNVKADLFVDTARTDIPNKTLVDIGAGLKLETPTRVLNLIYGRSLRSGQSVFSAYVEKRWW